MTTERSITCEELTEVLTDYLDGAMAPADVARFEAHLELCDGCVTYGKQMRQTIRTLHALHPLHVRGDRPGRPAGRLPGLEARRAAAGHLNRV